ncbi:MAG: hypothetical protein JSS83_10745 [Cyanobacteria bacterium SZAS LIN-3]|nr:hypothetical protein [Cyanobacteria bacterium SZAS LIN-3]
MFDYQAGEKQKLLLIMTAVSGVIAGSFFTLLLSSPGEAPRAPQRGGRMRSGETGGGGPPLRSVSGRGMRDNGVPPAPPVEEVDRGAAQSMVQGTLPLMWDFNSATANQSQEQAMTFMTQDCAQNYRLNVWTPEIAKSVGAAGMTSSFTPQMCQAITSEADGSVVVKVQGQQVLNLQGQPPKLKQVQMEYLVKRTPSGLKICGISESGDFGS